MKKIILSFIILTLVYFSSCTSVTEITGSWKKPALSAKKYKKVVVLGLSGDIVKRSAIENAIVSNFRSNGINAVAGSSILPDNVIDSDNDKKVDEKAKEIITTKFKNEGIDGAFVFSVEDIKESEHYVPGTSYYTPRTTYYPFYNHYYTSFARVNTPGYYTKTTQVFFISNFYDVSSEELVWSAHSETINPASLSDFSKSYSKAVVGNLLDDGVIRK